MDAEVPARAFAWPFEVTTEMVDVQGRIANHEIVRVLVEAAVGHSAALGWDLDAYRRLGAWFVVKRHEVDYHQPGRLGDRLVCHTWPSNVHRVSAERRHVVLRPADGAVIATALNVWVLIDVDTGRPRRITEELLEAFDAAKWRDA